MSISQVSSTKENNEDINQDTPSDSVNIDLRSNQQKALIALTQQTPVQQ